MTGGHGSRGAVGRTGGAGVCVCERVCGVRARDVAMKNKKYCFIRSLKNNIGVWCAKSTAPP